MLTLPAKGLSPGTKRLPVLLGQLPVFPRLRVGPVRELAGLRGLPFLNLELQAPAQLVGKPQGPLRTTCQSLLRARH